MTQYTKPTCQQHSERVSAIGEQWQLGRGKTVSQDDVLSEDSDCAKEEIYKPTSMHGLIEIEGYGKIGFESLKNLPPPPLLSSTHVDEPPKHEFETRDNIGVEEIRKALFRKVAENYCWGTRAAEGMSFEEVIPTDAFYYKLETFCEKRTSARAEEPYQRGKIDGPENGVVPLPWDIACAPENGFFVDQTYIIPVPHTDTIRECGACEGHGSKDCYHCHGCGLIRCWSCRGTGHRSIHRDGHHEHRHCSWCHGTGRRPCKTCGGDGKVICCHCQGFKLVKNFVQLTVQFINHVAEFILERTDMPEELVKHARGAEIFSQCMQQVHPVQSFHVKEVNDTSARLVNLHKEAFPTERIVQQRHTLKAVPVTEVACKWKRDNFCFWVYGQERKVHFPDYPQQCCWVCNIL